MSIPEKPKHKRYWVHLNLSGKPEFVEVPKGVPVTIPGLEQFDLFLHRPFNHKSFMSSGWRVSEGVTGLAAAGHPWFDTKEEAIKGATEFLCSSPERRDYIASCLTAAIERGEARSPCYSEVTP